MDEKASIFLTVSITVFKNVPGSDAVDNTLRIITQMETGDGETDSDKEIDGNVILKTYKELHDNKNTNNGK